MTRRAPVHILDPGAATDGQVPTYDAATGRVIWADGSTSGGVQSIVAGANVTVDNTDPANPVVSAVATGGSATGSADWRYEPYSNRVSPLNTAREDRQVGTWDYTNNTTAITSGFIFNSTGAQNDAIAFYIWLSAGTYRLDVVGSTQNNRAISTWELDDGAGTYTALGTMDWYAASGTATYNIVKSITGIVVSGGLARRRLRCKVATRNASATGWFVAPQVLSFLRTA